jgi:MYXO-CTERM domain-containing protein
VHVARRAGRVFDGGLVENIGGVMPFLSQAAIDALRATAAQTGVPILINSGFRTVAAQYLLFNWWQRGRCDLTLVAPPGESNHESGRALDIQNYGEVLGAMNANGWAHPYPGDDPWHFDHNGSPDIRGMDVHAFQRLWNRNHPEDPIDEDGIYGAQTDARLAVAPAEGFPNGPCTDTPPDDGDEPPGDAEESPADDLSAGCSAAGGAGARSGLGLLLALALLALRRRQTS